MKERLTTLRKALNLTMKDFGKKLGVTRSSISRLESGSSNFTDQMIRSICREYNVNFDWFTSGTGEMFVDDPQTAIGEVCKLYNLNDQDRAILEKYLMLQPKDRAVINGFIQIPKKSGGVKQKERTAEKDEDSIMIYVPEINYINDSDDIIAEYQRLYRADLTRREARLLESFLFFLTHDVDKQKSKLLLRK